MAEVYGNWEDSFQLLFIWTEEVLRRSPGSVIEIETKEVDGQVMFHRFFCALSPCIDGFKEGCRPYLSVDSTALNGRWNGHLAAATALDGHNWMYPVAYGFIDGESEESWIWFMRMLHKAVGDLPTLAICTDACKGLENAVKAVFPQAEQRECFRHLMQNYIKKWGGDTHSKMYPAARAYRQEVFLLHMKEIVEASKEIIEWLNKWHSLKWMRCAFNPDIKCDYITNNLAECFNNWIKEIKDLPICELADKLREMIMVLWNKRRSIGERLTGKILPAIIQQLKAKTRGLGYLSVVKGDSVQGEVYNNTSGSRNVVKAHIHDCTCLEWQHTGKPCHHALALLTAQQIDVNLEDYVHEYYSVERFQNAYKRLIEPLPDKSYWPEVDLPYVVAAPLVPRGVGRQRKLRIKSFLEGGGKSKAKSDTNTSEQAVDNNKGKKQMIRGKRKCPRCGELGHGESSYKCALNGTKKRKRKSGKKILQRRLPSGLQTKMLQSRLPRRLYCRTVPEE
jgi:zinc finger SWIM domain-containing protein 3